MFFSSSPVGVNGPVPAANSDAHKVVAAIRDQT